MTVNSVKQIRSYLKKRILSKDTFLYHESEHKQVFDLLKRTIDTGESNSALLVGPRYIGKTILVDKVLDELKNEFQQNAILVRLNGLVHTDDRLALKAVAVQMNLENAVDGKVFGSFAENLAFLLACLRTGEQRTSKSVVCVLDEFDLFCTHHNQTLLYNLFDVSQSAQTPLCVLGITCRLDVVELLEKRVKSRFSHRQIFLFPDSTRLEKRLEEIRNFLLLSKECQVQEKEMKEWNKTVENLCCEKKFKNLMQWLLDVDGSVHILQQILFAAVCKLNNEKPFLSYEDFKEQIDSLDKDETVQLIQDLSILELCLIIAMKHHVEIYDNQAMNFEMIFTRYMKFANAHSSIQSFQRPVVFKAFEHIKNMELVSSLGQTGGKLQKEYQLFKLLVTSEQIMDAINSCSGLPTEVLQWANSSFV